MVWIANRAATAARRTPSAVHVLAGAVPSVGCALSSGGQPGQRGRYGGSQLKEQSAAGTRRSLPGTPLAIIEASRMASPAHTHSVVAAPRTPQRRMTSCDCGYPQALSQRTMASPVTAPVITSGRQRRISLSAGRRFGGDP